MLRYPIRFPPLTIGQYQEYLRNARRDLLDNNKKTEYKNLKLVWRSKYSRIEELKRAVKEAKTDKEKKKAFCDFCEDSLGIILPRVIDRELGEGVNKKANIDYNKSYELFVHWSMNADELVEFINNNFLRNEFSLGIAEEVKTDDPVELLELLDNPNPMISFEAARKLMLIQIFAEITQHLSGNVSIESTSYSGVEKELFNILDGNIINELFETIETISKDGTKIESHRIESRFFDLYFDPICGGRLRMIIEDDPEDPEKENCRVFIYPELGEIVSTTKPGDDYAPIKQETEHNGYGSIDICEQIESGGFRIIYYKVKKESSISEEDKKEIKKEIEISKEDVDEFINKLKGVCVKRRVNYQFRFIKVNGRSIPVMLDTAPVKRINAYAIKMLRRDCGPDEVKDAKRIRFVFLSEEDLRDAFPTILEVCSPEGGIDDSFGDEYAKYQHLSWNTRWGEVQATDLNNYINAEMSTGREVHRYYRAMQYQDLMPTLFPESIYNINFGFKSGIMEFFKLVRKKFQKINPSDYEDSRAEYLKARAEYLKELKNGEKSGNIYFEDGERGFEKLYLNMFIDKIFLPILYSPPNFNSQESGKGILATFEQNTDEEGFEIRKKIYREIGIESNEEIDFVEDIISRVYDGVRILRYILDLERTRIMSYIDTNSEIKKIRENFDIAITKEVIESIGDFIKKELNI